MMRFAVTLLLLAVFSWSAAGQNRETSVHGQLARAVQPFIDRGEMGGTVMLVASKDKVLTIETAGFGDPNTRSPQPPDSIFFIASQTKSITATALMMLVDDGKVDLDDPVEKYLPEFACVKIWKMEKVNGGEKVKAVKPTQTMRVRHLITHTTGLDDSGMSLLFAREPDHLRRTVATHAQEYAMKPLSAEPGTKFNYGSSGMTVAAHLIEVVSGMSYTDFLKRRLFDPLGMKDTTFFADKDQSLRLAKVFSPNRDANAVAVSGMPRQPEIPPQPVSHHKPNKPLIPYPEPAGGLLSTAADIGRFCRMFLNGGKLDGRRYLKESTVEKMLTKQTGALEANYGFGWWVDGAAHINAHGGAVGTMMTIDRKHDLVMIWMVAQPDRPDAAVRAFEDTAVKLYGRSKRSISASESDRN